MNQTSGGAGLRPLVPGDLVVDAPTLSGGGTLALLVVIVALGLGSRIYRGALPFVMAEYAGDMRWATAVFGGSLRLVRPSARRLALAASLRWRFGSRRVNQLAHSPWLDALRQEPGVSLILGYDLCRRNLVWITAGVALAGDRRRRGERAMGEVRDRPGRCDNRWRFRR